VPEEFNLRCPFKLNELDSLFDGGVIDFDASVPTAVVDDREAGVVELIDPFLLRLTVVVDEEHIEELDEDDDKNDDDEVFAFGPILIPPISLLLAFEFKIFMAKELFDASSLLFSLIVILEPIVAGDCCC
jgi:hypothetical protein